ncbi:MAG: hypothetical protein Kow0056_07580 [Coriobacteriia bacterium]
MRTRILLIIAALIAGGLAAVFAARYLSEARSQIVEEATPVTVLVAAQDIPRGLSAEELDAQELLVEEEIPAQFVSSDAVSSVKSIEGQVLAVPMAEGEQVTRSKFQYPTEAGLTYTVPAGYLAVTIPTDEIRGVAGFIKPGDTIAVVASFDDGNWYDQDGDPVDPNDPRGVAPLDWMSWRLGEPLPDVGWPVEYPITRIVLPEVKVLATESNVSRTQESLEQESGPAGLSTSRSQSEEQAVTYDSVTVAVTDSDLEKLVFCEEYGQVWLALVGADTETPESTGRIYGNAFME